MKNLAAAAALLSAGCYPIFNVDEIDIDVDGDDDHDDDDDTTTTTTTAPVDSGYTATTSWDSGGPPFIGEIDSATVYCDGSDQVHLEAVLLAPAVQARIFMEETGNVEPHWSENHSLAVVDSEPGVSWTERVLETGVDIVDRQRDVNTLFGCTNFFDRSDVMTYAFVALDALGEPILCAVFGDDPHGMKAGAYQRVNEPEYDLSGCDVWPTAP